jgi:hypothetical protein
MGQLRLIASDVRRSWQAACKADFHLQRSYASALRNFLLLLVLFVCQFF